MLLQTEGDRHSDVNGNGLSIQLRRLVFPQAKRIGSGTLQKRIAVDDFRGGDLARSIDKRIDHHVALHVLSASKRRIGSRDRSQQLRLLQLAAFNG